MILDTGQNLPETYATLMAQQRQLLAGRRPAQMFPVGTPALPLPGGNIGLIALPRGIFHYDPKRLTVARIAALSKDGRENEILNLGPFSKPEIAERVMAGEFPAFVAEFLPGVIELRLAGGTLQTIDAQRDYFEATKEPGGWIVAGPLQTTDTIRLIRRIA